MTDPTTGRTGWDAQSSGRGDDVFHQPDVKGYDPTVEPVANDPQLTELDLNTTDHPVRDTVRDEAGLVAQTAADEAGAVKDTAVQGGQRVAETAKAEATELVHEAKDHLRTLADTARHELRGRAWDSYTFAGQNVRSWSDELSQVLRGESTDGPVGQVARTLSTKGQSLATWLDDHDPEDLAKEIGRFASRRPLAFLALAAGAGVLVGRFGRGLRDSEADEAPAALTKGATASRRQRYEADEAAKDYYRQRRSGVTHADYGAGQYGQSQQSEIQGRSTTPTGAGYDHQSTSTGDHHVTQNDDRFDRPDPRTGQHS